MQALNVHFLPQRVDAAALAASTVVVIDMLRASSTICQALASGATCVTPFLEVEETLRAAERYPRTEIVLGGERHGKVIAGFDLGNSPLEYTPEAVAGKRLLFTTTNGTQALAHAAAAARTLVGCGLNRQAVSRALAAARRVDVLCAGTDGSVTGEDILAAGAILGALLADEPSGDQPRCWQMNDGAKTALQQWRSLLSAAESEGRTPAEQLALQMRTTPGGRNLLEIGHDYDLVACAQLDAFDVVPQLDRQTGEIRPA